jgi:hypothetical protein
MIIPGIPRDPSLESNPNISDSVSQPPQELSIGTFAFLPALPASPPASSPGLRTNIFEQKWFGSIYVPPVTIDFAKQEYSLPKRKEKPDASGFQAIPIAGEKVTRTVKASLRGELHVIPVDTRQVVLDIFTRENLNRVDTSPLTTDGMKQVSFSPDLWTSGAVIQSNIITHIVTRGFETIATTLKKSYQRESFRIEPLVGFFDDSSLFHFKYVYQSKQYKPGTGEPYRLPESDPKP